MHAIFLLQREREQYSHVAQANFHQVVKNTGTDKSFDKINGRDTHMVFWTTRLQEV